MKPRRYLCPSCGKEGLMDAGGTFFCEYCKAFVEV